MPNPEQQTQIGVAAFDARKRWLIISGSPAQQALWRPLSERFNLAMIYDGISDYAASIGVKVDNLNRYITVDVQERSFNEAALLAANMVQRMGAIKSSLTQRLNGNTPPELETPEMWLPGYLMQKAQFVTLLSGALNNFIRENNVAGVVVHEDVAPDMRAVVGLARQIGLPTIHLPHAPCHLTAAGGEDIHRHTRAEWIGASGPQVARFYAENGHDPHKIAVVGGVQWDGLYGLTHVARDEARRIFNISENKIALWYGATWAQTTALRGGYEPEQMQGLRAVLRAAKQLDAWLLITLHPNDNSGRDQMFLDALRESDVEGLVTRFHLPYIAAAADAVIAQGPSNLCIDAAIQGVPAMYLQTEGFDYATEYPLRCWPEDVSGTIEKTLASRGDPKWDGFIREYNAAHPDGQASVRAAEWIDGLCQM